MKKARDWLIVIVLGGVVVSFLAQLVKTLHDEAVANNMTVHDAEIACMNDRIQCHVGYDSFPSVANAEAYLKSAEHLAAVKARQEKEIQEEKTMRIGKCIVAAKSDKEIRSCYKEDGGPDAKAGR
jgi:hypothetical protein